MSNCDTEFLLEGATYFCQLKKGHSLACECAIAGWEVEAVHERVTSLEEKIAALTKRNALLEAFYKATPEWIDTSDPSWGAPTNYCYCCDAYEHEGHAPDCPRQLLNASKGE